jgi:hypothetical protein
MRRLLHGLLLASLLLGACGGDGDGNDRAAVTSIPDDTTTSTTTTVPRTVAPDVIPQDVSLITEEYVEQVLNELLEVSGDALRVAIQEGLVEERAIALIEATSSSGTVTDDLNELLDIVSTGFAGIKDKPTSMRVAVIEVLVAQRDCVLAEVKLDRSGVVQGAPADEPNLRTFAKLVPAADEQRASGHNPTAWVTDGLPTTSDGSAPPSGCSA